MFSTLNNKIKLGVATERSTYINLPNDLAYSVFNGLVLVSTNDARKYILLHVLFKFREYNYVTTISNLNLTVTNYNNLGTIAINGMSEILTNNKILAIPCIPYD